MSTTETQPRIFKRERAMIELASELIGAAVAEHLAVPTFDKPPQQGALREYPVYSVQELIYGPNGTGTSDSVYEVAGEAAMWPLSVMCRLVTSNAVADRTVALEYRDQNGSRFLVAGTQAVVQASTTQSFCWHPQAGDVTWPVEDAAIAPLPQQHLFNGMVLALKVGNGQAGDVIDTVRISARFDAL
jgi:hypothetical protein